MKSLIINTVKSSLIKSVEYDCDAKKLTLHFHNQNWKRDVTYCFVPISVYFELIDSESKGKYFLESIEPIFKTEHQVEMLKRINL
jgi:hypothetical protein